MSKLLLVSDESGSKQIYSIRSNGAQKTQLTFLDHGATQAKWSPDLSKIVFTSLVAGSFGLLPQLFVMNADGSGLIQLPGSGTRLQNAHWIDGNSICFESESNTPNTIVKAPIVNLDSTATVSPAGFLTTSLALSANKDSIAFVSSAFEIGLSFQIRTESIDGGSLGNVSTPPGKLIRDLTWSPNATTIAYSVQDPAGTGDIYTSDLFNIMPVNLTEDSFLDISPVYSPDGQDIIYSSRRSGKWVPFEIHSNGTGKHIWKNFSGNVTVVDWR